MGCTSQKKERIRPKLGTGSVIGGVTGAPIAESRPWNATGAVRTAPKAERKTASAACSARRKPAPQANNQRPLGHRPRPTSGTTAARSLRPLRARLQFAGLASSGRHGRSPSIFERVPAVPRLAERYGHPVPRGVRLSHHDFSTAIGCAQEAVTNLLRDLQRAGCIETERRQIVIINPERLAALLAKPAPAQPARPRDAENG